MKIRMFGYIWTIQEVLLTVAVIVLLITNIITLIKYIMLKKGIAPKKELSEFDKTQKTIRLLIITIIISTLGGIAIVMIQKIDSFMFWEKYLK